jgi:hypothetical protein
MKLTPAQADRFFATWFPLLVYVNDARRIVPRRVREGSSFTVQEALSIRDALWADDALLDAFVAENPAGLSPAALATVASWKYRVAGRLMVWKHYKKHTVCMLDQQVYAVLGLRNTLEEIIPMAPPTMVGAVLLPFEGVIVADGLLTAYNVTFGPGVRRGLKDEYDRAVERGAVRTSLLPEAPGAPRADPKVTNQKVLAAFRSYLFDHRRLKGATVDRDLQEITRFAEGLGKGRSLLEWSIEDVKAAGAPSASSLKRFVAFMMDTERTAPGLAEKALDRLRAHSGGR